MTSDKQHKSSSKRHGYQQDSNNDRKTDSLRTWSDKKVDNNNRTTDILGDVKLLSGQPAA